MGLNTPGHSTHFMGLLLAGLLASAGLASAPSREWCNLPVEELTRLAQDSDPETRARAVMALGKFGGLAANKALLGALRDPVWSIRWKAAEGIGKNADPSAIQDLLIALRSEVLSEEVQRAKAERVTYHGYVPVQEFLQRQLAIAIREVIARAPTAGEERARNDLTRVIGDASERLRVRAEVGVALGELGDRRSIPVLIDALSHEPSGALRASAAVTLGSLKAHEARAALVAALDDPYETPNEKHIPIVRNAAARALREIEKH